MPIQEATLEHERQGLTSYFRGNILVLALSSAVSAALGALVGGFTFQIFGPAVPFYVFAFAEPLAALLLIRLVKEPLTREG